MCGSPGRARGHGQASTSRDRLAQLLLNDRWLEAKLRHTNVTSLLTDIERLNVMPEFELLADAVHF